MGPARTSATTGHGNPYEDPHLSKHGAAPAPIKQKTHPVDQTRGKDEDADDKAGEPEDEGTKEEDSEQKDASSDAKSPSEGEGKDDIDEGVVCISLQSDCIRYSHSKGNAEI